MDPTALLRWCGFLDLHFNEGRHSLCSPPMGLFLPRALAELSECPLETPFVQDFFCFLFPACHHPSFYNKCHQLFPKADTKKRSSPNAFCTFLTRPGKELHSCPGFPHGHPPNSFSFVFTAGDLTSASLAERLRCFKIHKDRPFSRSQALVSGSRRSGPRSFFSATFTACFSCQVTPFFAAGFLVLDPIRSPCGAFCFAFVLFREVHNRHKINSSTARLASASRKVPPSSLFQCTFPSPETFLAIVLPVDGIPSLVS